MSSIGTVEGYLKLTDEFTTVLDRAMGALQKSTNLMQGNLAQMQAALDMTGTAAEKMGSAAKKAGDDVEKGAAKAKKSAGVFTELRAAYAIAAIGIWQFIDRTVAAQQASDRMRNSLLAGTGDMRIVGEELAFIRAESARLGLDLAASGVQYGKLTAASKGTGIAMKDVRATFTAVAEAATALGLSSEDTTGALNAVVQMMTKGTAQAEELRGQLGDRVPGAVQAMSRALGVTNEEMMKMLEQGKVITAEVLPRFAEELRKIGGSGVEAGAQSFNAELNRLKTSLFDLFAGIASDTSLPEFVKSMREFVEIVDDLIRNGGGAAIFENLSTVIQGALGSLGSLLALYTKLTELGDKGLASTGTGLSLSDFTPVALAAGMFDRISDQVSQSKQEVAGWASAFKEGMMVASSSMFTVVGAFQQGTIEADKFFAEVAASGRDLSSEDLLAFAKKENARNLKEIQDRLENLTKESIKFQKANAAAFDLEDKLKNQSEELAIFQKLLKQNGGDFALAKKNAASYYAVLKAGLDPLQGWGKALYEMALSNDAAEKSLEDGKKAAAEYEAELEKLAETIAEDLADAHKGALEDVTRFGKGVANLMAQMDSFRTDADRYWGALEASSNGADALREFNKQAEISDEILKRLGVRTAENAALYDMYAAEIRDSLGAIIDHRNWVEKTLDSYEGMADVLNNTDWGSQKMNDLAGGLGQVMSAMGKLRTATKLFSQETAQAWAGMLQGINAVLEATGAFQTGNGGGFGGTSEGNYAAEGQMVGAIIGGIIGAFVGAPQAGMAIGAAAGGIMGGFIKKGAEEALASLTINTEGFSTAISKAEGALGQSISTLGNTIGTSVMDIVASIGGTISSLPQVDMKIRDGVIGVVVGGVKAKFQEMDDAISFAVAELLKQGDIIGIDEMLRNALQNTSSSSLEGLSRDLEAVMKVLSFGMTESQQAIQGFTNELDGLRGQMVRLLSDSDQLAKALNNISMEEVNRWQNLRDQITGDKRSNAEKLEMLKRDAEMWNAEKALRVAELMQKKADLEAQYALAKAQVDLYMADQEIGNRKYEFDLWKMRAQGQLLDNTGEMYMAELQMRNDYNVASLALIQAQMDALGQVIAALNNMPDIDVPNLRLPHGVGNSPGGAPNLPTGPTEEELAAQDLENLFSRLKGIFDSLAGDNYFAALGRLKDAMYEQIALAHGDAAALEMINQAYEAQIEALEQQALQSLGLASVDLNERMNKLADTLAFLRDQGAITEEQMHELGMNLYTDILGQLAQAIGDSKTLAMLEEIRYDAMKMNARLEIERLALMGAISKEQYEALLAYLNAMPDDLPDAGGGGGGDTSPQEDPTDTLLDRLIASIEDLRNTLANYQDFLTSLERGPLSGATLQQQYQSAQSDFMQMLAAAQAGDMNAIRDLPGMAQEFLQIAAQYLDPASAEYQRLVAMMQTTMGGIANGIEGIIGAAPESALGSNGVLDTIAEILAAMASRWGVNPGWNVGNVQSGGFNWNPVAPVGSEGGSQYGNNGNLSSQQLAQIASLLSSIDRNTSTQNDLTAHQTDKLAKEIRAPKIGTATDGWTGPVSPARRAS